MCVCVCVCVCFAFGVQVRYMRCAGHESLLVSPPHLPLLSPHRSVYVGRDSVPRPLDMATLLLGCANSSCNPIIYGVMNGRFRRRFRRLFCWFREEALRRAGVRGSGGGGRGSRGDGPGRPGEKPEASVSVSVSASVQIPSTLSPK